ncbi:oxidoreductase [Longimonas halophila]|uniref:Oxidoreductase n=1 Tax=Longimonas halophila TaxID=1469170 RepID=A0A2H3NS58_9BACT|nr:NAD(P)/FAD-dependent oxidoreductase [Longimonas halophila]PEN06531.1 oxidoreductase [Longimonas halophila]
MTTHPVTIVGAGLAGLTCATYLHRANIPFRLIDAADAVGGRVRTDSVEGFTLDRGFQVLLTAYPECQALLDYDALNLQPFYDGALVRTHGHFHRIADPFRHPFDAPRTLFAPVGTLADKLRVARMRSALTAQSINEIFSQPEQPTRQVLATRWGFSDLMIDRFFRPFFGGIFFDTELQASSRLFEFLFKMFAEGDTTVPAQGMQAIPNQLAAQLPSSSIDLNTQVAALENNQVRFDDGTSAPASAIVIATDAPAAHNLLGDETISTKQRSTTCLYYAAPESPLDDPILALNGDQDGLLNNVAVMSDVAPSYAPDGETLISAVVVGDPLEDDDALERTVRRELIDWFGLPAGGWTHLRTYRIEHALPDQTPPSVRHDANMVRHHDGVYVCGDYLRTASINDAMGTGRMAAEAIRTDRSVPA